MIKTCRNCINYVPTITSSNINSFVNLPWHEHNYCKANHKIIETGNYYTPELFQNEMYYDEIEAGIATCEKFEPLLLEDMSYDDELLEAKEHNDTTLELIRIKRNLQTTTDEQVNEFRKKIYSEYLQEHPDDELIKECFNEAMGVN